MINKNRVICDDCGESRVSEYKEFKNMIQDFKDHGFINSRIGGKWFNFCSQYCFQEHKDKWDGVKKIQGSRKIEIPDIFKRRKRRKA